MLTYVMAQTAQQYLPWMTTEEIFEMNTELDIHPVTLGDAIHETETKPKTETPPHTDHYWGA